MNQLFKAGDIIECKNSYDFTFIKNKTYKIIEKKELIRSYFNKYSLNDYSYIIKGEDSITDSFTDTEMIDFFYTQNESRQRKIIKLNEL